MPKGKKAFQQGVKNGWKALGEGKGLRKTDAETEIPIHWLPDVKN